MNEINTEKHGWKIMQEDWDTEKKSIWTIRNEQFNMS